MIDMGNINIVQNMIHMKFHKFIAIKRDGIVIEHLSPRIELKYNDIFYFISDN